ncbi:hypothetical protein [Acuticoccus sp.]|uniref:hypothetical protein n=1 Tax=Acuticoccus sp. TaxID=1904378 RepID=UPI003B526FE8
MRRQLIAATAAVGLMTSAAAFAQTVEVEEDEGVLEETGEAVGTAVGETAEATGEAVEETGEVAAETADAAEDAAADDEEIEVEGDEEVEVRVNN